MMPVNVRTEQDRSGWWIATCKDLPGLFIAHPDRAEVEADITPSIEALRVADSGEYKA